MSERQWYYVKEGGQVGPVAESELRELLRTGALPPAGLVWTEGMEGWRGASEVQGLTAMAPAIAPPPATIQPPAVPPEASPRPVSVTVFGILNIVFGSLALLGTPFSLLTLSRRSGVMNPTPLARAWLIVGQGIGLLGAVVLLSTGIGLLRMRSWARKWAVGYGCFAIAWGIVAIGVNAALMAGNAFGYSPQAMPGAIGGMVGGLVGLAYPILTVIFLRKPHVRAACCR